MSKLTSRMRYENGLRVVYREPISTFFIFVFYKIMNNFCDTNFLYIYGKPFVTTSSTNFLES